MKNISPSKVIFEIIFFIINNKKMSTFFYYRNKLKVVILTNPVIFMIFLRHSELCLMHRKNKLPKIPLTNNISENDIQIFTTKKFMAAQEAMMEGNAEIHTKSLKKICRKLEISFYKYFYDRIAKINNIPQLSEIIQQKIFDST